MENIFTQKMYPKAIKHAVADKKKLASCTNYGGFVYFSVISVPAEFTHTVYISRHMMKRMSWSRNFLHSWSSGA